MGYLVCFASIAVPLVFWCGYHYYKDRYLPEPVGNLVLSLLLGVLSFFIGKGLYGGLDLIGLRYDAFVLAETSPVSAFVYSVLVIGTFEELAKFIPFLLVVLRLKRFDEPIDGIIYASFIALGFAAVENLQYAQFLNTTELLARGFAGPLVHVMFASIWGYHVGRAYLCRKALPVTALMAVGITALLHGGYDFVILALPAPALPASALLILAIWVWRMRLISDLHRRYSEEKSL